MKVKIEILKKEGAIDFYSIFARAMKTAFPCYSPVLADFFINKIYTPVNFIYWLNNNLKTIIVARLGAEILGFAVIDQPYGGVSFCRWLAILPEHQKKGLGKKLIEAWIEMAKMQGCHKVELASQPLARGFYEKAGLTLEGERKMSYFGIDQFVFGKIIGRPNHSTMTKYY